MPKTIRLTLEERKTIQKLIAKGLKSAAISRHLGRGKNTITVEIRRSGGYSTYNAIEAQKASDKRWEDKHKNSAEHLKGIRPAPLRLADEIRNLKFQIEILHDTIKEILNENNQLRAI